MLMIASVCRVFADDSNPLTFGIANGNLFPFEDNRSASFGFGGTGVITQESWGGGVGAFNLNVTFYGLYLGLDVHSPNNISNTDVAVWHNEKTLTHFMLVIKFQFAMAFA